MDNLSWKIKQLFRKYLPLMIVALLVYGGYRMYQRGAFRHGVSHAVTTVLRSVPVLGSHFPRSWGSAHHYSSSSYSYSGRRHARRHGRHSHGRRRRHHRRHR